MGRGRLGSDQRFHAREQRQDHHRRQTPFDGTRAADEVHAGDEAGLMDQDQASAESEA
ncbi:MAG: hypothetical protein MZV64_59010 [Ignavibacteriales bacterium]|nr:hypothetical protein [Ignavibacteriales bacterium]